MALINTTRSANGGTRTPPNIYIDIFQPTDFGSYVVEVSDPAQPGDNKVICTSQLPPDYGSEQYEAGAQLVNGLPDVTAGWKQSEAHAELIRYGRRIYADLFGTSDAFVRHLKRARHLQNGFQFQLRLFNSASPLWSVPWEYAHDGEMFLVTERGWPMFRIPRDMKLEEERAPQTNGPRPLRVLVVMADPMDAPPLNAEQEIQNIRAAVREAEQRGLIVVDFIEEGTLRSIDLALSDNNYHVLHYIGHGTVSHKGRSLVLETETGDSFAAHSADLISVLRDYTGVQLVLLNACRTGSMSEARAVNGVAMQLFSLFPSIVTMQCALHAASGLEFTRTFYSSLAIGQTLENALQAARQTMYQKHESASDWGAPVLYIQRPSLRLIDPQTPPVPPTASPIDVSTLPQPKIFIGRREQQRTLRRLLTQLNVSSAYVWGLPGIGKSALVRRIIERPGRLGILTDACVIDCATTNPREMLTRITTWLETHFPKSAEIMRNPLLPPDVKIAEVAPLVRGKRLVLVIDRFDKLFQGDTPAIGALPSRQLQEFFVVLASAQWSVLTIFTSRLYWNTLPELTQHRTVALHLRELDDAETTYLIEQSTHLHTIPPQGQTRLLDSVGGHPATLSLIETALSRDPSRAARIDAGFIQTLVKRLEAEWLNDVLQGLSAADVTALIGISFLNEGFWSEHVRFSAQLPNNSAAEEIMVRWEMRGVTDFTYNDENQEPWYIVPTVVRAILRHRQEGSGLKILHRRAAEAIQYNLCRSVQRLNEAKEAVILPIQRDNLFETAAGYLKYMLQHAPIPLRRRFLDMALDWRVHWLEAGRQDYAREIVSIVWHDLALTFNSVEMARNLLLDALKTAEARETLPIRANLARLTAMLGKSETAIDQFNMLAGAFGKSGDLLNQSAMLAEQSRLLAPKNIRRAVQLETEALALRQKLDNPALLAESYAAMSRLKQAQKDLDGALKMSEQAWEYAEKSQNQAVMASALLTQGALLLQLDVHRDAGRLLDSAADYASRENDTATLAAVFTEFAALHNALGNHDTAAQYLQDAITYGEQVREHPTNAVRMFRLAETYFKMRAYTDAYNAGESALEMARKYNPETVADIQTLMRQLSKLR